jgi:AcrR family transcriptional regulator
MGRKRAFDREQIAEAALAVLDRDGLPALSMRAVADELGTGAMTLYNYVTDRVELEALVVDAVSAQIRLPPPGGDWRKRVHAIGLAIAAAVQAHPGVVPLMLTRRSTAPEALRPAEALLEALNEAGLSATQRLVAFRTLLAVITGIVQADVAGPVNHAYSDTSPNVIDRFSNLERTQFPNLISMAHSARTSSLNQELSAALRLVITAIAAQTR